MEKSGRWLNWAVELQSLAQAGLTYGRDTYDRERYQRIREVAAEMMAHMGDLPLEKSKTCSAARRAIRPPSWTPAPPFFKTEKSCSSGKTTENGPSPAAGAR